MTFIILIAANMLIGFMVAPLLKKRVKKTEEHDPPLNIQ